MTPLTRGISIVATIAWLAGAIAAYVYRDALLASDLGKLVLVAMCFPIAFAIYMLTEGLGEGVVFLLVLAAFKLVTLGLIRTEFTSQNQTFPWYGIARNHDGKPVASEGCIYVIGTLVYVAAGVAWYLWNS